ncbi:MAG: hypothetical protein B1H04_01695 [Planctomycetales bacterium 4484_123]|nr:MAG: hypothetical protein B1H04_01695 [Planctomycetales bacterium 4484_123]
MAQQQRLIHFSGTVQGVGFRFTAAHVAVGHSVTGYVKNLPDGRVELLVEGEEQEIDAFLAELQERMRGYIRQVTEQRGPASGRYTAFQVRF